MLSELRLERTYADGIHVEWSPKTLHQLLDQELPGAQVIVVSNREPYIHNRVDGGIVVQTPASGLVTALEPVMRACGGTWIAHGRDARIASGRRATIASRAARRAGLCVAARLADDEKKRATTTDSRTRVCGRSATSRSCGRCSASPTGGAISARTGISPTRCSRRRRRRRPDGPRAGLPFRAVAAPDRPGCPTRDVRAFWHIPWPNAETFGICPWQNELLDGLLGADRRFSHAGPLQQLPRDGRPRVEIAIEREQVVTARRPRHLGAAVSDRANGLRRALARQRAGPKPREPVRARFGVTADLMGVGVERFDYTKGMLERIQALERSSRSRSRHGAAGSSSSRSPRRAAHNPRYQKLQR